MLFKEHFVFDDIKYKNKYRHKKRRSYHDDRLFY